MKVGKWRDAIITVATDDVLTPEVDLERDYQFLEVVIPTITSATVSVQVAEATGGTFQVYNALGITATGHFLPATTAGVGGITTTFPLGGGFRFIKVATGAAQAANRTFRVRGTDNYARYTD